jgi:hypothetical protein
MLFSYLPTGGARLQGYLGSMIPVQFKDDLAGRKQAVSARR